MRILLLSMPDAFEHTPTLAIRMPNGGARVARRQRRSASRGRDRRLVLVQSAVGRRSSASSRRTRPTSSACR